MNPFCTLVLLLLILPYIGWTQGSPAPANEHLATRLGINVLHDFGYAQRYQWKASDIAARLRRQIAVNVSIDRQLHPRLRRWRGITQIGYHRAQAKTTAADLAELRAPLEQAFTADFTLDFLHISSGLLLELAPESKSRPYLSGQLVVTLPVQFQYHYRHPLSSSSGVGQTVNYTTNISPAAGWQIEGGMHIDLEPNWAVAFGLHYLQLHHFHNWLYAGDGFGGTEDIVLTMNPVGAHVRWLYRW